MNWWSEYGWPSLVLATFCVALTYLIMTLAVMPR
jgi:hypothetical protein